MASLNVAVLGATGETGFLSPKFWDDIHSHLERQNITALTRPSSLEKPAVQELKKQGVKVVAADIEGPEAELVKLLEGMDVVVSCIDAAHLLSQIPLANACKAAGVGRFIPCCFATVAPPKGVLVLRDIKEEVLNHVKKIYLPYTGIDVGWWYQTTLPRLPSGRNDDAMPPSEQFIAGEGNTPYAITDIGDIGLYTARIIADPRTLNRMVFAYNEVKTQNQIYDLIEKLSGETVKREHVPVEKIQEGVAEAAAKNIEPGSPDFYKLAIFQYWNTWGIRGDNTPEYARYLGYLVAKDLYPDLKGKPYEQYCKEALDGKAYAVYKGVSFV